MLVSWIGRLTLASFFWATTAGGAPAAPPGPADVIYTNGEIFTLDAASSRAEALAVREGLIMAVGSSAEVLRLRGPGTQVRDLRGRVVLPGFIDAHGHFPGSAIARSIQVDLSSPPVGTVRDIDDIVARLAQRARTLAPGAWLQGNGYDDTLLADQRHPTRADLDRVSATVPIYIAHVSGHLAVANTAALRLAGIDRTTPQPAGGHIRIDPVSGEPNGVLEETALALLASKAPGLSDEQIVGAIEEASREYASRGITTAQSGAASIGLIQQSSRAVSQDRLSIRLNFWPVVPAMKEIRSRPASQPVLPAQSMLAITAAKLFADGSIQGYTGYLTLPYHTHSGADPDDRGYPRMTREALAAQVLALHRSRVQVAIHANGDAAIDDVLEAFERAQKEDPWLDARHVVVHSQMARDDQLDRMATLGVIPSFFVLHTYYWGDRHRDIFLGPERAARISPTKSALDRGLRFTLHADTPVVPMDPLTIVWAAVNRLTSGGQVLGPEQRITPLDALKAITINAAFQEHQEASRGSLEVGKFADLVVLSANPLTIKPGAIRDIQVLETVVGGRPVFVSERR